MGNKQLPRVCLVVDVPPTERIQYKESEANSNIIKERADKITLQNPNPSVETALRNFSLDCQV
jgi:hypothetical protein